MKSRISVRIGAFAACAALAAARPSCAAELYTLKEEPQLGQLVTFLSILGYLDGAMAPQSSKSRLAVPDASARSSRHDAGQNSQNLRCLCNPKNGGALVFPCCSQRHDDLPNNGHALY